MNNWNLSNVYPSFTAWEEELLTFKTLSEKLKAYKSKITNKETLSQYLCDLEVATKILMKLYSFASMKYDLDQKNSAMQEKHGLILKSYNDFISNISFFESDLLKIKRTDLDLWIKEDTKIGEYKFMIEKVFHTKKHIFSSKIELILSNYNSPLNCFNNLYDLLAVADSTSKTAKLSDDTEILVTQSNYRGYLAKLQSQDDRRKIFEAVFTYFAEHKNTFAGIYNGIVQSDLAVKKSRNYRTILDSYLFTNNISPKVFKTLISTTKTNSGPLKKYYKMRKNFFKLKEIHTYDRFLDFASTDIKFTYEESHKMVLDSLKSIGGEIYELAQIVLQDGRVDVYENEGKRTGAYSTGIHGYGTYILLNHDNTLSDAFTVAHEAGHSIHTMLSEKNQPFATADYTIFVAEIASTFNEQLFLDYLISHSVDKELKIVLLQQAIDGLIGTFYRQSLFADYEYQAHKIVEDGGTITAENLSAIMKDLYKQYFSIDLNNEEYKEFVWAYIPHFFHSPFYVYQYATSFAASMAIYEKVKNKVPGAYEKYLTLLKSGGSDYPVELVKLAGVNLEEKETFLAVVRRLEELLAELEKLLG